MRRVFRDQLFANRQYGCTKRSFSFLNLMRNGQDFLAHGSIKAMWLVPMSLVYLLALMEIIETRLELKAIEHNNKLLQYQLGKINPEEVCPNPTSSSTSILDPDSVYTTIQLCNSLAM